MCGYMMALNMYETKCVVAYYAGIEVHAYAEVVYVFLMILMYLSRDGRKDGIKSWQSIFERRCSLEIDQV